MLNTYLHITKTDKFITKKIDLDTILWIDGKKAGKLQARFEVIHEPFFEQKIAGVMTEDGLMKAAPLVLNGPKIPKTPKLAELSLLFETFNELIFSRQKKRTEAAKKDLEQIEKKIKDIVEKINKILLSSEKKSSTSFVYNDVFELIKAQSLFLDIGEQMWTTYDRLEPFMDSSYYACLESLLKRGEFELSNLSLGPSLKPTVREPKVKIAFRYQRMLYEILNKVFDDIENKGLSLDQRKFIEFFLAYCYFRVPDFRIKLLQTLTDDSYIEESRAKNDIIKLVLFSWREEFYTMLPVEDARYISNKSLLHTAINKNWTHKFRTRGIIFFYFIREWCDYVRKSLVVSDILWETIPGYDILVENFVDQMKKREMQKYPEILIESSLALLHNGNLLKTLVFTLLEKTKLVNQSFRSAGSRR